MIESTTNVPNIAPLPLERTEKLKIFSVLSLHNDIQTELLQGKTALAIVVAYNGGDAINGAVSALKQAQLNPTDYLLGFQIVELAVDQVIETVPLVMQKGADLPPTEIAPGTITSHKVEKESKSKEQLVSHVKYVFGAVGTKEEQKIAETVIDKFLKMV